MVAQLKTDNAAGQSQDSNQGIDNNLSEVKSEPSKGIVDLIKEARQTIGSQLKQANERLENAVTFAKDIFVNQSHMSKPIVRTSSISTSQAQIMQELQNQIDSGFGTKKGNNKSDREKLREALSKIPGIKQTQIEPALGELEKVVTSQGGAVNTAALQAAMQEVAKKLSGDLVADVVISTRNGTEKIINLQQNLKPEEVERFKKDVVEVKGLIEESANLKYSVRAVDPLNKEQIEKKLQEKELELRNALEEHPQLQNSLDTVLQEYHDYYTTKAIQKQITELAKKAAVAEFQIQEYRMNYAPIVKDQFNAIITEQRSDLLARKPELEEVFRDTYNAAYEYKHEILEKGHTAANQVILAVQKNDDKALEKALADLNREEIIIVETQFQSTFQNNKTLEQYIQNNVSNGGWFSKEYYQDNCLAKINHARHTAAEVFLPPETENTFKHLERESQLLQLATTPFESELTAELDQVLRSESAFYDFIIELNTASTEERKICQKEIEKRYGNSAIQKELGIERYALLEKAFNAELKDTTIYNAVIAEFNQLGNQQGQYLAIHPEKEEQCRIERQSLIADLGKVREWNPELTQELIRLQQSILDTARAKAVYTETLNLYEESILAQGPDGDNSLNRQLPCEAEFTNYERSQSGFLLKNPDLKASLEKAKAEIAIEVEERLTKVNDLAKKIITSDSSTVRATKEIIQGLESLNPRDLALLSESFNNATEDSNISLRDFINNKMPSYAESSSFAEKRAAAVDILNSTDNKTKIREVDPEIIRRLSREQENAQKNIEQIVQGNSLNPTEQRMRDIEDQFSGQLVAIGLAARMQSLSPHEKSAHKEYLENNQGWFDQLLSKIPKEYERTLAKKVLEGGELSQDETKALITEYLVLATDGAARAKRSKNNQGQAEIIEREFIEKCQELFPENVASLEAAFKQEYSSKLANLYAQDLAKLNQEIGIEIAKIDKFKFVSTEKLTKLTAQENEILSQITQEFGSTQGFEEIQKTSRGSGQQLFYQMALAADAVYESSEMGFTAIGTDNERYVSALQEMEAKGERALQLAQEVYKLKYNKTLKQQSFAEHSSTLLDKAEAIRLKDKKSFFAAELAEAANAKTLGFIPNADEAKIQSTIESIHLHEKNNSSPKFMESTLDRCNQVYQASFGNQTLQEKTKTFLTDNEQYIFDAYVSGKDYKILDAKIRDMKTWAVSSNMTPICHELEKIFINKETGKVDQDKIKEFVSKKYFAGETISAEQLDEGIKKFRFELYEQLDASHLRDFWSGEINYSKIQEDPDLSPHYRWALALTDIKNEDAHIEARVHKFRSAVKGSGTDEDLLDEVFQTETKDTFKSTQGEVVNREGRKFKEIYEKVYSEKLSTALKGDEHEFIAKSSIYRLEHGQLDEVHSLIEAVGREKLDDVMTILDGKTPEEIKKLEKDVLAVLNDGNYEKYSSLTDVCDAFFLTGKPGFNGSELEDIQILLEGIPRNLTAEPSAENIKTLAKLKRIADRRNEKAQRGADWCTDLFTDKRKQITQDHDQINVLIAQLTEANTNNPGLTSIDQRNQQIQKLYRLVDQQKATSNALTKTKHTIADVSTNVATVGVAAVVIGTTTVMSGGTAAPAWAVVLGGAAATAGGTFVARKGVKMMVLGVGDGMSHELAEDIGVSTFEGGAFILTAGTANLIGRMSFKLAEKGVGGAANRILGHSFDDVTQKFVVEGVETTYVHASKEIQQKIIEQSIKSNFVTRTALGTAEGSVSGGISSATYAGLETGLNQETWNNGLGSGLVRVSEVSYDNGVFGMQLGGISGFLFSMKAPKEVKLGYSMDPEKAMKSGILDKLGEKIPFFDLSKSPNLKRAAQFFRVSHHAMSHQEVEGLLRSHGTVTFGDYHASRLKAMPLSERQANKLIASKNITPDERIYLKDLHSKGQLSRYELAIVNNKAPNYFLKIDDASIRTRQEALDGTQFSHIADEARAAREVTNTKPVPEATPEVTNVNNNLKQESRLAETPALSEAPTINKQTEVLSAPETTTPQTVSDDVVDVYKKISNDISDETRGLIKGENPQSLEELQDLVTQFGSDSDKLRLSQELESRKAVSSAVQAEIPNNVTAAKTDLVELESNKVREYLAFAETQLPDDVLTHIRTQDPQNYNELSKLLKEMRDNTSDFGDWENINELYQQTQKLADKSPIKASDSKPIDSQVQQNNIPKSENSSSANSSVTTNTSNSGNQGTGTANSTNGSGTGSGEGGNRFTQKNTGGSDTGGTDTAGTEQSGNSRNQTSDAVSSKNTSSSQHLAADAPTTSANTDTTFKKYIEELKTSKNLSPDELRMLENSKPKDFDELRTVLRFLGDGAYGDPAKFKKLIGETLVLEKGMLEPKLSVSKADSESLGSNSPDNDFGGGDIAGSDNSTATATVSKSSKAEVHANPESKVTNDKALSSSNKTEVATQDSSATKTKAASEAPKAELDQRILEQQKEIRQLQSELEKTTAQKPTALGDNNPKINNNHQSQSAEQLQNRPLSSDELADLNKVMADKNSPFYELKRVKYDIESQGRELTAKDIQDFIKQKDIFDLKTFPNEFIKFKNSNFSDNLVLSNNTTIDSQVKLQQQLIEDLRYVNKRIKEVKAEMEAKGSSEYDLEISYKTDDDLADLADVDTLDEIQRQLSKRNREITNQPAEQLSQTDLKNLQEALQLIKQHIDSDDFGTQSEMYDSSGPSGRQPSGGYDGDLATRERTTAIQDLAERVSPKINKSIETVEPALKNKPNTDTSSPSVKPDTETAHVTARPADAFELETHASNQSALDGNIAPGIRTPNMSPLSQTRISSDNSLSPSAHTSNAVNSVMRNWQQLNETTALHNQLAHQQALESSLKLKTTTKNKQAYEPWDFYPGDITVRKIEFHALKTILQEYSKVNIELAHVSLDQETGARRKRFRKHLNMEVAENANIIDDDHSAEWGGTGPDQIYEKTDEAS